MTSGERPQPRRRRPPLAANGAVQAATIRDVAESAGVSTATVSRVFGGSQGRVSSATRRRVLRVAQELGYRPHRAARALARQRSGLIGVLLVGFGSGFVGDVMDGLVEAARGSGREVVFASYGRAGYGSLHRALDHLLGARAEGIICYPPNSLPIDDPLLVADLKRVPTVLVDLAIEGLDLPLVTTDDASGVRQAVDYLVSLGHERIAHLAGPSWMSTGAVRLRAFREAMAERGLQTPEEWLVRYDFSYGQAVVAAQRLFQASVLPTAVLAADDKCAAAVLEVARHAGLRVPDDLSVVGFSDIFLCHTWQPPLTTVRQPKAELGREAVRLVAAVIEGDTSVDTRGVHLLPTELVVRESCGRCAGSGAIVPPAARGEVRAETMREQEAPM